MVSVVPFASSRGKGAVGKYLLVVLQRVGRVGGPLVDLYVEIADASIADPNISLAFLVNALSKLLKCGSDTPQCHRLVAVHGGIGSEFLNRYPIRMRKHRPPTRAADVEAVSEG